MWSNLRARLSRSFDSGPASNVGAAKDTFVAGERVLVLAVASVGNGDCFGSVLQEEEVSIGQSKGPCYAVEIFAPTEGEEDAMNPLLIPRTLRSVLAERLRPLAFPSSVQSGYAGGTISPDIASALLGAVGRPGASMCSVPLVMLHNRGTGRNAMGRSARIGGLANRPDLNGLTGTVQWGPNEDGLFTVELRLDEGEQAALISVWPACVTLRVRRTALPELLAEVPASRQQVRRSDGYETGEIVKPALSHQQGQSKLGIALPFLSTSDSSPARTAGAMAHAMHAQSNDTEPGHGEHARMSSFAAPAADSVLSVKGLNPPQEMILEGGRISTASSAAAAALAAAAADLSDHEAVSAETPGREVIDEQITLRNQKFEELESALADAIAEEELSVEDGDGSTGGTLRRGLPALPAVSQPRLPLASSMDVETSVQGVGSEARTAIAATAAAAEKKQRRKERKKKETRAAPLTVVSAPPT